MKTLVLAVLPLMCPGMKLMYFLLFFRHHGAQLSYIKDSKVVLAEFERYLLLYNNSILQRALTLPLFVLCTYSSKRKETTGQW